MHTELFHIHFGHHVQIVLPVDRNFFIHFPKPNNFHAVASLLITSRESRVEATDRILNRGLLM